MYEKRREGRYEYSGDKIEYHLDPFSKDEPFEAIVINFNQSGLCLLSDRRLTVGQEITILDFLNYSRRSAVVLWIAKNNDVYYLHEVDENMYKMGLLFA